MFDFIKGQLKRKAPTALVLENGGIGYRIVPSMRTFQNLAGREDGEVLLYIHYHLREDELTLYGFAEVTERNMFELLLSVSGVGAKLGLKILAETEPGLLVQWIGRGDSAALSRIKGLGEKTAARLILDLKKKVQQFEPDDSGPGPEREIYEGSFEALKSLGYREAEIKTVLNKVFSQGGPPSLEEAIKNALAHLSSH